MTRSSAAPAPHPDVAVLFAQSLVIGDSRRPLLISRAVSLVLLPLHHLEQPPPHSRRDTQRELVGSARSARAGAGCSTAPHREPVIAMLVGLPAAPRDRRVAHSLPRAAQRCRGSTRWLNVPVLAFAIARSCSPASLRRARHYTHLLRNVRDEHREGARTGSPSPAARAAFSSSRNRAPLVLLAEHAAPLSFQRGRSIDLGFHPATSNRNGRLRASYPILADGRSTSVSTSRSIPASRLPRRELAPVGLMPSPAISGLRRPPCHGFLRQAAVSRTTSPQGIACAAVARSRAGCRDQPRVTDQPRSVAARFWPDTAPLGERLSRSTTREGWLRSSARRDVVQEAVPPRRARAYQPLAQAPRFSSEHELRRAIAPLRRSARRRCGPRSATPDPNLPGQTSRRGRVILSTIGERLFQTRSRLFLSFSLGARRGRITASGQRVPRGVTISCAARRSERSRRVVLMCSAAPSAGDPGVVLGAWCPPRDARFVKNSCRLVLTIRDLHSVVCCSQLCDRATVGPARRAARVTLGGVTDRARGVARHWDSLVTSRIATNRRSGRSRLGLLRRLHAVKDRERVRESR